MKNIIIAGPARAGKTTLAKRIHEEYGHFVLSLDKLMTVFGEAYPALDIRIGWNPQKAAENIAPFIGHFLGMFFARDGTVGKLNLRAHAVENNAFVLEGGHFDFETILPILRRYGIKDIREHFILIGLTQVGKTAQAFMRDLRTYDTEEEWTKQLSEEELKTVTEKNFLPTDIFMESYLPKFGFKMYNTAEKRETVFERILSDIRTDMAHETALTRQ